MSAEVPELRSLPRSDATKFARWAAWGLGYTLLVILFGAVVRITGSGAGCGQHWPTCHGEVTHLPRSLETAIELTHRVTSGLCLVVVVALWIAARRRFTPDEPVRFWAGASVVLMITESLVGAALVLARLVGENDSWVRAAVMSAHLVNTSLLVFAMAATAWTGMGRRFRWQAGASARGLALGLAGVLAVSMTGAVTALGDTLYPLPPGTTALTAPAGAHFLKQLRVVHPLVAVAVAGYLLGLGRKLAEREPRPGVRRFAGLLRAAVVVQLVVGGLNVLLSAPGWLQVLHLAIANAVWLSLTLLLFEVFEESALASRAVAVRQTAQAPT